MLNTLSSFIPASDRIITIEDAAEFQLQQKHVGRLETRPYMSILAAELNVSIVAAT